MTFPWRLYKRMDDLESLVKVKSIQGYQLFCAKSNVPVYPARLHHECNGRLRWYLISIHPVNVSMSLKEVPYWRSAQHRRISWSILLEEEKSLVPVTAAYSITQVWSFNKHLFSSLSLSSVVSSYYLLSLLCLC